MRYHQQKFFRTCFGMWLNPGASDDLKESMISFQSFAEIGSKTKILPSLSKFEKQFLISGYFSQDHYSAFFSTKRKTHKPQKQN